MASNLEAPFQLSEVVQAQLRELQRDPNVRIMGSIGRMAICQWYFDDPYYEFRQRQAAGLVSQGPSDIDVIGATQTTLRKATSRHGLPIDDRAFNDTDVAVRHDRTSSAWRLVSQEVGFEEEIDEEYMSPLIEEVAGVKIVTLPFVTHGLLHKLRSRDHAKDVVTEELLDGLSSKYLLGSLDGLRGAGIFVQLREALRSQVVANGMVAWSDFMQDRHSGMKSKRHSLRGE